MTLLASLLISTLFAVNRKPPVMQTPLETTARQLLSNFARGEMKAATRDFNDDLRPVVTPALLAEVKGQLDAQAGMFWSVTEVHQGMQGGFRTVELIARFEKMPVSVLVVFDSFDRVGAVYFNPLPAGSVDPTLEKAARELLDNIVAHRFDEAVLSFDATMRAQLPPTTLAVLSSNVTQLFGTFRSVTSVQQTKDQRYRIIGMTLSYTKAPVSFRVAFDEQGRVAALNITPAGVK